METFLLGAIAMACAVAALYFFLYFGLSFLIEAINRTIFALGGVYDEEAGLYYLIRLGSYLLILWAIFAKNFPRRKGQ